MGVFSYKCGFKLNYIIYLILCILVLGIVSSVFSQEDDEASDIYQVATSEEEIRSIVQTQLEKYPNHAAAIIASAIVVKLAYTKIIVQTILALVPPETVAEVITAAIQAAPEQLASIINTAVSSFPEHISTIVQAGILAAPEQMLTVVRAAVAAAPTLAAAVVVAAIAAGPDEVVAIVAAAAETAPQEAANIARVAVAAFPVLATVIVSAAVEAAPIFSSEIVQAAVDAAQSTTEASAIKTIETVATTRPQSGGGDTTPDDNRQPEGLITSSPLPSSLSR